MASSHLIESQSLRIFEYLLGAGPVLRAEDSEVNGRVMVSILTSKGEDGHLINE